MDRNGGQVARQTSGQGPHGAGGSDSLNAMNEGEEPASSPLPDEWRGTVLPRLATSERILGWFAPDLDARMRYAEGLVVLTDHRLIALGPDAEEWPLDPEAALTIRDRTGIGTVELVGPRGRRALWKFTLARAAAAHRVVERFEALRRGEVPEEDGTEPILCVSCGEPIPPGKSACPACARSNGARPAASLFRLFGFARQRMGPVFLGFVLTLTSTSVALIPPLLTIRLMQNVLEPKRNFDLVPWYLLGLFSAAIVAWMLSWAKTYVIAWVSERVAADLRVTTYAHLQRLSLEYFGGKRTGDLIARVSSDTERICNFLSINLLDFATDLVMITLSAGFMFYTDVRLALVTLIPFPIITWMVYVVRKKIRRHLNRGGRAWSEMTSVLADTIPGIRVVKAFAQEQREVQRFRMANDYVLEANDRVNRTWSFFGPLVNLLTQLGLLIVWAFGSWQIATTPMNVSILMGFQILISPFYVRLEALIRFTQTLQRAATSTQRIFAILDRSPSVAEPSKPVPITKMRGEIAFKEVGFRHGSRHILSGINLTIQPGELVGLVGPSGAGKSTLVNLVCRFYDVGEGSILVDGVDVRSFALQEYRQHIGIVLQEPFLFFGTIAENIAYGRPGASPAEIVAAARAAKCHEFILKLADGYDSLVGERGQSLSGGERQRISIARALLIDPRILILDEATSSVDTETEREIQEALDNLIRGRTTIAIAHRLSTLRKADRLVVLERGRIVQVGGHHELVDRPGVYARLHKAQAELAAGPA